MGCSVERGQQILCELDLVVVDGSTDGYVVSPMLDTFRGNGTDFLADATTALPWDPGHSGSSSTLRAADLDKNGTLDVMFFGPQSDAEGHPLSLATPSPCPEHHVLMAGLVLWGIRGLTPAARAG